MSAIFPLFLFLLALGVSLGGTYWLSRPDGGLLSLDHPNERSLHTRPIPRGGGIAILSGAGLALGLLFAQSPSEQYLGRIVGCALLIAAVSLADDYLDIHPAYRLLTHVTAGVLLLLGGVPHVQLLAWTVPPLASALFSLLFVVWMVNLYNFMDGMDGFAGGMTLIGFGALGILGWEAGNRTFALACAVVAITSCGFLVFNFPPAKIFMGDVGSSSIGFLAAAFSLWGNETGVVPIYLAVLIFSPFIVDSTVTLLRRALRGERIWEAHRTHFYQRLVQMGWGHRRTVLCEYLLMLLCSVSAVTVRRAALEVQWMVLVAWTVAYALLAAVVNWLESRRDPSVSASGTGIPMK